MVDSEACAIAPSPVSGIPGSGDFPISREDLPPADTKRWVIRRKAAVVAGVRAGLITLEEACTRYALSVDEFLSWKRRFEDHGIAGLRATLQLNAD